MPPFYVTTPIYYVNDAPHVGHAYTTVNADAIARWHRLAGDEVFFLTGTDEHGAKVAEAAAEHGVTPAEWADTVVKRYVEAWSDLHVGYDDFIRTTEPRHHASVQAFLGRIFENGYIRLGTWRGLYCVSCEDYYSAEQAHDGRCPVHGRVLEEMEEENYFFELSRFQDRLVEWYEQAPTAVGPLTKRNEALSFIRGGLRDISISRTSLRWGVPVPWDPSHVFYVWCDALVNYLTAIGYPDGPEAHGAPWERWWPAVHHLIGKEIVRFHCVWWPAMCMAAGLDPPAHVFAHGWLLVGGEKLSKTLVKRSKEAAGADGGGSGETEPVKLTEIAPQALTEDFGVDAVRYHLLRDVALGTDGEFSYEQVVSRYNADLANNLGNLLARVATVVDKKCGGIGPRPDPESSLGAVAEDVLHAASEAWGRFAPHEALEATWRLVSATNAALEATEPWRADPGPAVDAVLGDALEALRIVAVLVSPAMPTTAQRLWHRIGLGGDPAACRLPEDAAWGGYSGGLRVEKGAPLFPRRRA